MSEVYLWQNPDFPHFYWNNAVVERFEQAMQDEMHSLIRQFAKGGTDYSDLFTEEILANSEIEGVFLDRESVHSSFVKNVVPTLEKESGAVALTRMALDFSKQPLSHETLKAMHCEIMKGSSFPDGSVGVYVGDMQIVSGRRIDVERNVIHEGIPKALAEEKMSEFIEWYNSCSASSPLINAIQGHIHFEVLHPFCDGNGRIGRSLMLMGLCRDFGVKIPLALSRVFNAHLGSYYAQFETGLDLTEIVKSVAPLLIEAVGETKRILELTVYRTTISDAGEEINSRQHKVLNRLVEYELKGGFQGGVSNANYQKMTGVTDRTALRDLRELEEFGFVIKTGQFKATRYHLNTPTMEQSLARQSGT